MAPHRLIIAPAAKNDLKAVYQYGLRQWGMLSTPAGAEDIAISVSAAFKGLVHRRIDDRTMPPRS